jgi:hypothetical protein
MSASVTLSPNRCRPARGAASASRAAKPSLIQWRYQSSRAAGQALQHAQIVDRMDVGDDGERQREDVRAIVRVARQQRRGGQNRLEPGHDGEALGNRPPIHLEHRHETLRIAGAIAGALLCAVEQIDRKALIFRALEVERDPHPVARRGAIIIVEDELHRPSLC